jgi:drug/metabolite transporter (DMT)-like permease
MANVTLPTPMRPGATLPTLAILGASVCFGLVPLFVRELYALGMAGTGIAFWRFAFSAVVMLPFLPLARAKRRQALMVGGAGLAQGLSWVCYMHAIETGPLAITGVIYMSYPIFALIFAWVLLKSRPTGRAWIACALVLAASALVIGGDGAGLNGASLGTLLWSVPAPVFFGLIIVVLSSMVMGLSPFERMAAGMWGSVIGLAPLAIFAEPGTFQPGSTDAWLAIAGLGAVTALVPQLVYTFACARVGPARAAAAGSIELPTMIAIGWLAFAEQPGWIECAAVAMVLAAILMAPPIAAPAKAAVVRTERVV